MLSRKICNPKAQAPAAPRDKAHQELAGPGGDAGADLLPQAPEGLECEEDQRGAVRHGRLRRVRGDVCTRISCQYHGSTERRIQVCAWMQAERRRTTPRGCVKRGLSL